MSTQLPLYVVLFSAEAPLEPYSPIRRLAGWGTHGTIPHGLDPDLVAALPGLWYCLHLPRTLLELTETPVSVLRRLQSRDLGHGILLIPLQAFDAEIAHHWANRVPVLVATPDALLPEARRRSTQLGFQLSPVGFSELSDASLVRHWRAIHQVVAPQMSYWGREPSLSQRLDLAPLDLPARMLARQMDLPWPPTAVPERAEVDVLLSGLLSVQGNVVAIAQLENDGVDETIGRARIRSEFATAMRSLQLPVTVAVPGVPARYVRRATGVAVRDLPAVLAPTDPGDTWEALSGTTPEIHCERAAIELVVTHSALAVGGLGLTVGSVPEGAFQELETLEAHFRGSNGPNPGTVRSLLARLQTTGAPVLEGPLLRALAHASRLIAFSNFPVGLLRLPGDTAALACRMPVAYRPLLPLTRTLQNELRLSRAVDLNRGFRVLVAECIDPQDPVGQVSRRGWDYTRNMLADQASDTVTMAIVETLSVESLRSAIADHPADVLVISAHGFLSAETNIAGIVVGDEPWLGIEIGEIPPVAILSACHVAPRGVAAVGIADLLLREGALAVIGTQVPVDVGRNAMLMMRFFLYLAETVAGRRDHPDMLAAWHFVQTSNVVNDILSGNPRLADWGYRRNRNGLSPLEEFMSSRFEGALRPAHIYEDAETALTDVARDQGEAFSRRVRGWFRDPGYVPESLFYAFVGRPENVYLRSLP